MESEKESINSVWPLSTGRQMDEVSNTGSAIYIRSLRAENEKRTIRVEAADVEINKVKMYLYRFG